MNLAKSKRKAGTAKAARRKIRKRKGVIAARRKKEFTYRGYTMDARGMNEEQQRFIDRLRACEDKVLKTHRRDIPILPDFVGKKVAIHAGNTFKEVQIKPEMIGHFLGEFALTRKEVKHSGPGVGATRSSKYMPLK
jgi:small subunit ribosomal protein S19